MSELTLNEYQKAQKSTAIYPKEYGLIYTSLKLAGESGEVCEKIGKHIRDKDGLDMDESTKKDIIRELGDSLWYISAIADELDFTLEDVARTNMSKLFDRQERGVLKGSGDNR